LNFYSLAPPWFKKISNFVFCPICHRFWKQSLVVGLHSICCGWSTRFKAWRFSCGRGPTYSYSWTKSLTPKSPYFERKKG
jgi:hypothetical protein